MSGAQAPSSSKPLTESQTLSMGAGTTRACLAKWSRSINEPMSQGMTIKSTTRVPRTIPIRFIQRIERWAGVGTSGSGA